MKNTVALLATAANLGSVAATFGHGGWGGGFHDAPSFTCPGNHDNICVEDQIGGWDWSNLQPGSFDDYFGFDFNGWTCEDDDSQRRDVSKRSFGAGKRISAKCGSSLEQAPSFGCGNNANVDNFSVSSFQIAVEFDCRLEFHYNMPDGSTCKHSAQCSTGGTTVPNTQCGGATDVHVVFPEQPDVPQNECGIDIHHIDFDCDDNTPPPPAETSPPPAEETTPPPAEETTPPPAEETTPPPAEETTPPPAEETTPPPAEETTPPPADETSTFPSSSFNNSTSVASSTAVSSSEIPSSSQELPPTSSIPAPVTTPSASLSTPITTTYDSTSTVFTTTIETITSCAPEVPDCPGAGQTTVVTHTVAISTTICPVTETITPTPEPTESPEEPENPDEPEEPENPEEPEEPEEPLPCPPVVPSCLNTFLNLVTECQDNLDVACFCPNQDFLEQVYACVYGHADSDDIISEGLAFIQGICAPYIPQNPGIVTGIETITNIITVTGTPIVPSVPYTTVVIATTVTEPCVSNGVTISTSSTTRTITSEVTIPQITIPPTGPVEAPTTPAPVTPAPSTISTRPGTISNPPVPTATGDVPIAGAAKVNAGLGLGLAVMVALAL